MSDKIRDPIPGVPDTDPPEDMTPGGKMLWNAMRAFAKSGGDTAAFNGLLTQRVRFIGHGRATVQALDENGQPKPGTERVVAISDLRNIK